MICLLLCSTDTDIDTTQTQIYIKSLKCKTRNTLLYNYELYKFIIKIYVHKYVSIFFYGTERCFSWLVQKDLFLIFIIILKIYTINLSF